MGDLMVLVYNADAVIQLLPPETVTKWHMMFVSEYFQYLSCNLLQVERCI